MKKRIPQFFIFHFSLFLFLLAGCFDEPTPARDTVLAENRVYLKDAGLGDLASAKIAPTADYLNLDRNALTNVVGVEKLVSLKWLRLNDNRLTALPSLAALVNLRRIYLRGNRFSSVPETLKDLPALTDIELSGNPIREIPAWLAAKKGLLHLSFNQTGLMKLPDDLSAWRSLKSLQLGNLTLSAAEMARIRAALPDTAIVF